MFDALPPSPYTLLEEAGSPIPPTAKEQLAAEGESESFDAA